MTDYTLWEVILNGDSPPIIRSVEGVETPYPPTTVEEKLAMRNELKARGTLLMALPNEHQLKFNSYKNAKSLMEAIKKIFEYLKTLSIDDLYNNLKIYEAEVMGSSSTTQNTQNVAFVFSNNTDNTNKVVNTAHGVSAANSKTNAFNLPNVDSLKEIDLKWQMEMLTMRARIFLQKTGRNLSVKGIDTIGFDKTKVECYNCHIRGHFARKCKTTKHQDNKTVPVEDTTSNAFVSQCDGLGYDWSDQAEDELTDFALMAYTFSSSSSSDTEVSTCSKEHYDNLKKDFNKSQFNLGAYKAGLESVEARLEAITKLRQKLKKARKERDDLKLTLEKFQDSSKNLSRLLDSQQSDKSKTVLGYNSQGVDSSVLENQENDKTSEGYHAVPPPYTGNFMSPKPNLVLANEHVVSESVTSQPNIAKNKVKTSETTLKNVSAPITEDSVSDSEDEDAIETESNQIKPSFAKLIKKCDKKKKMVEKPVWNNAIRANHHNSQRLSHPHSKRNFVSKAVLTNSGLKTLNTACPKSTVNDTKPSLNVFHKTHSPVRRTFNQRAAPKNSDLKEKVNTVKGKVTTTGTKAVVSVVQGNGKNVVKSSACWIWRPTGNVFDHISKDSGSYMIKRFNYVDLQGGLTCLFVKATIDESNLWHRRLGHINSKTINKLVRRNLIRAQVPTFQTLPSFPQQYPCCEDCGVTHEPYQCQPKNHDYYDEQNSCYDSNSFGFDQIQTPQYTVNHPIFNAHNDLLDSQNKLMKQMTSICEMVDRLIQKKQEEKQIQEDQAANTRYWKIPAYYDDDDDYNSAVTPNEPVNSLIIGDKHLDTVSATESDELIKSSVENLVPNPNFSKEIFSNPLFEEEISSIKIDQHHFNAKSDLVESMLNRDSSIISSSSKIDSLLDEFAGELTLLKSIPPGVDKTDCHPKNKIRLSQRLLYDNSSPRPPEDFVSKNSNADDESFSPSPIMEEIDLFFTPDDPMPPSIEDDEDSEGDILFLERLLHDDPIPLPDIPDFLYEVRTFLLFFTYPVTSSILLSSGSEDTIFDPGIYHFSSLEPDLSHRCGTFKQFNTHRSHLNESPIEMLFSTYYSP
nr:hypothetical protein [Tanacetum cinerariifolium]